MTIRTFTAATMAEALAVVQEQVGKHAVVLHTRTYKRGGLLGLGAKTIVEVTAADGRQLAHQRRKEAERSPRATALRQQQVNKSNVAPAQPAEQQLAGDLIRRTYQAARAQFDGNDNGNAAQAALGALARGVDRVDLDSSPGTPGPSVATPVPIPTLEREAQMAKELATVKHLVQEVVNGQRKAELGRSIDELPDPLVAHYTALIQQEIAAELANELVRKIAPGLDATTDVQQALRDEVAKLLPTDPDAGELRPAPNGGPRIIALVGPTGVGKTTTVAKLAATFKLKQNKRVGLITADTYRIAAVDQLRTYAGIIGLPLEVVSDPRELAAAIARMSHLDAIVIDTAGRSQRDAGKLDELARLLEVAQPHETHLVLSSTASQSVLMETVEKFAAIRTDRLIFTKLDEAVTCGVLLNVARRVNKPLSYITTGQEVPHQIEPGHAGRLAGLVLGAGVKS